MERLKKLIFATLSLAAILISTQNPTWSNEEKKLERIKVGDSVPAMTMKDINGKEITNTEYLDRIIVYSFADRKSNKTLQEMVGPAAKKIVKIFPETKIAYINFADVVAVPNLMKHIVNPILKYINESNTKEMKKQYAEQNLPWDENITTYFLIPEWEGDLMKNFGLENASEWQLFITYDSKVRAVLDSNTKNFTGEFVDTFKKIVAEINKQEKKRKK